jgi:hypothetical protein
VKALYAGIQEGKSSMLKNNLILAVALIFPLVIQAFSEQKPKNKEYLEFNYGQDTEGDEWVEAIEVISPELRSEIQSNTTVEFEALGMKMAKAMCWQQPTDKDPNPWGHDVKVAEMGIGSGSRVQFTFPANKFPHGPTNIRIYAHNGKGKRDIFELQLYNKGGVNWKQGIPKDAPPGAKDLQLIFKDDFDGPLSISRDGIGAQYNAHKPGFGDFSGYRFSDPSGQNNPFEQIDTYLRIKARKPEGKKNGVTGLIASVDMNGEGIWAKAPSYFECRFIAQSAPGTWPAFWTLTHIDRGEPSDELDIVECYGGVGKKNPNHPGYSIVSHFWRQKNLDGSRKKSVTTRPKIMDLGGKNYWSTTFHTYGVNIGMEDTVYYFDNIEVLRHPTNDRSRDYPACFLINYAIGGISGWKINLKRFGNGSDMYIDWVRVYTKEKMDYSLPRAGKNR